MDLHTNEGSASDGKTKVDPKQNEVSCWNCFTTVTAESATEPEAATLPIIRQKTRQKYKLYSFLASQLSRPKAIPLTQKVSENYAIGKKVEQKMTEKAVQTNISLIEQVKNNAIEPDKIESLMGTDVDITKSVISVTDKDPDDDKGKKVQDYIREYNLFEAYKSVRRKTPTPNSTLERTNNNATLNKNDSTLDRANESNHLSTYKKLEIVQPKLTIYKVYESPSINITSNTSQERLVALENSNTQTSYLGKEVAEIPKNKALVLSQITNVTKQDKSLPNLDLKVAIPISRRTSSISRLDKSYTSPNEYTKAQSLSTSLKTEDLDRNEVLSSAGSSILLISPKSFSDNIQIKTSTPKLNKKIYSKTMPNYRKNIVASNRDDINIITEGIRNISLEIKEPAVLDKTDNASLNESESGYSGSSTRDLPEADVVNKNIPANRQSVELGNETDSFPLSHRIPELHFKTSLPVLASHHRDISIFKSLTTGSNPSMSKPVKKLRWSTLGLTRKSNGTVFSYILCLNFFMICLCA